MKKKFKKVVIVGMGLIGGSIGKTLLKKGFAEEVVAVVRRESAIDEVMQACAATSVTLNDIEAVKGADVLILAVPVGTIVPKAIELAGFLSKGCLVTDVGSTKGKIVEKLEKVFEEKALFVGSHPMAGTEKGGVFAAREDLFDKAVCILTPTPKTPPEAVTKAGAFWSMIGMEVIELEPVNHDKVLARISHLPHLAAYALVRAVAVDTNTNMNSTLVAGGFLGTTRIASSPPNLWVDIFFDNSKEVIASGKRFIGEMEKIIKALEKKDEKELLKLLEESKVYRDAIVKKLNKG